MDSIGKKLFSGKIKSKSFSFDLMKDEKTAFMVKESLVDVWHKILGHFYHSERNYMMKNQMVLRIYVLTKKTPEYKTCQFGNLTRK